MAGADQVFNRLPVRIVYEGFYKDVNGNTKELIITHDYHEFYTYVQNRNAFNVNLTNR